jgi:hypothetical protein
MKSFKSSFCSVFPVVVVRSMYFRLVAWSPRVVRDDVIVVPFFEAVSGRFIRR